MAWIQEHWDEVMAIVGCVYAIARIVVALTPTPKDDAVLGTVAALWQKVVKGSAKVTGLDPKKGVQGK